MYLCGESLVHRFWSNISPHLHFGLFIALEENSAISEYKESHNCVVI
jgi:hypothetical protein